MNGGCGFRAAGGGGEAQQRDCPGPESDRAHGGVSPRPHFGQAEVDFAAGSSRVGERARGVRLMAGQGEHELWKSTG